MRNRRRRRRPPGRKSNADRFSRPLGGPPARQKRSAGTRSQTRHGAVQWGYGGLPPSSKSACFMKQALLAGFCVPPTSFLPNPVLSEGENGYFPIHLMNVATFSRLSLSSSRSFSRSSDRREPLSSRPSKNSAGLISK